MTTRCALLIVAVLAAQTGCAMRGRLFPQQMVFDTSVDKEQLITHLNRNITGTTSQSGIVSWQSNKARLRITGVPAYLPTSIAVEAPRNFRMLVSNPMTGGQEVDIGSNPERFWFWQNQAPEMVTVRHEDVPLALQHIRMPVHIHPDWLMEALGVIPLDPHEYQMGTPHPDSGIVDLVTLRKSPLGQNLEKVVRVDLARGEIREHFIRIPGGDILARARLDDYRPMPNGAHLAHNVKLYFPEAKMAMTLDLHNVTVNPPALAHNKSLWQMPQMAGCHTVDIGAIARMQVGRGANPLPEMRPQSETPPPTAYEFKYEMVPGRIALPDSSAQHASLPNSVDAVSENPFAVKQAVGNGEDEAPAWAKPAAFPREAKTSDAASANPFAEFENGVSSAAALPSAYSVKASRSSWDQLPPGRE
ncbi:MAG: hypothetical protein KDA80_03350 [Planctomycetaceae bacterium]|nr:hypothetical protein [Planctomycetaceae bacterium]